MNQHSPRRKPKIASQVPGKIASLAVSKELVLDGRCALFHRADRWLAVADTHYGYELSRRAAGALFPQVGMEDVRERLLSLITDYRPAELLLLGDLVHDRSGVEPFCDLLAELQARCVVRLIAGNHDRGLCDHPLRETLRRGEFLFHHGHLELPEALHEDRPQEVCGHFHPAVTLRDGAGLRLKLPALARDQPRGGKGSARWILPAFSPWAAGGTRAGDAGSIRRWACHPRGIIPVDQD